MIGIMVNGEKRQVEQGTTVDRLLEQLGITGRRVAVERNREIVRRDDWKTTGLEDGDRLEVIEFVGGGI